MSDIYDHEQLQPEETLVEQPTDDILDTGYRPPDERPRHHGLDKSPAEEHAHETIEERLAQEEPEDPDLPGTTLPAPAEDPGSPE
ncbi:hypothetical protein SAMN05421595_1360 [Austwickia chelonae]|uniref:DUF5709 domain-containing protein n=1 Tax=Austwickia chelonae NBRC 105200 TaxID=1184607 RepID=K6V5Q2_9MICO|nr:hypothetical protein [Austwickia chelonae]GAB77523.1 hypothetical protein AUCHE_05_04350 [Austwickia chelonae NBRC 105200]SEW12116.1 hypothetical protein SAMN05421595_1360 [Austwickia chelonae]